MMQVSCGERGRLRVTEEGRSLWMEVWRARNHPPVNVRLVVVAPGGFSQNARKAQNARRALVEGVIQAGVVPRRQDEEWRTPTPWRGAFHSLIPTPARGRAWRPLVPCRDGCRCPPKAHLVRRIPRDRGPCPGAARQWPTPDQQLQLRTETVWLWY